MTVKIGLISDIHATVAPLIEAFSIFETEGVKTVLCAGDIAGYGNALGKTIDLLVENDCQSILGNHDIWWIQDPLKPKENHIDAFYDQLPVTRSLTIAGKHLYVVHGSPPQSVMDGIKLLDQDGHMVTEQIKQWEKKLRDMEIDVLVVGHTHQVFAVKLGNVLVINPGSTRFNHSCAILTLPQMEVRIKSLQNKPVIKAWNWGMYYNAC